MHPRRGASKASRSRMARLTADALHTNYRSMLLRLLTIVGLLSTLQSDGRVLVGTPPLAIGDDVGLLQGFPKRHGTSRIRRSKNTYGSHYFLSFSAVPLKKHVGFYKNTMVSLNSVAYGLTEHLSVGGSLDLVSLIRSREGGPIYSGRMQLSGSISEIVHIGVSASYINTRVPVGAEVPEGTQVAPGFVSAMAMLTIGSINNQITVAGGWTHDGNQAGRGPVLNIGGAVRVFANVMFVTEHWIFSDPDNPFKAHSFGARILGDDLAIDVGVVYDKVYTAKITPVGLPFVSATLNF